MKFYHPLAILALLVGVGCEKDDPKPVETPDEIVKKEITATLASEPGLSRFVEVFAKVDISTEEMVEGITVFAPADAATTGRTREAVELNPEILRGHIVKGLIEAGALQDGQTLQALNGNQLTVSINGDEIRINGVLISAKDLATDDKFIVHKVEEIIHEVVAEPASLSVTVLNSVKWSQASPAGMPEPGVTVEFYASRTDYTDGVPEFSVETNASGVAVFPNPEVGKTYYIVAHKGALSNIFYRSGEPVDGLYLGFVPEAIFQTAEEIAAAPFQADAMPGNLRWRDMNGDGLINEDDKVALPYAEVVVESGAVQIEVFIGHNNNELMAIRDAEDAYNTVQGIRTELGRFQQTLAMIDGVLSDDADCSQMDPSWCALDNFAFDANHQYITQVWTRAYGMIGQLNFVIRELPGLSFSGRDALVAEAKAIRAYIYIQMATYFGDVPILTSLALEADAVRAPRTEVYNLAEGDLTAVLGDLLVVPTDNREIVTADAARMILARLALRQGDYSKALNLTDAILQGGRHALAGSIDAVFTARSNSEIIWDFSYSMLPPFAPYFFDRSFCPALRLAEVYLINAEAKLRSGNPDLTTMHTIRDRLGMDPVSGTSFDELLAAIQETWQQEMRREGDRFANVVRWNLAPEEMAMKGFNTNSHRLLPVPQLFLDQYPSMTQNPNY